MNLLKLTPLLPVTVLGITFDGIPNIQNRMLPPSKDIGFCGWSTDGLVAGQTIFTNGTVARDGAFVAWPVGPYTFAGTLHVMDWWLSPELRCDRIRMLGVDYAITNTVYIGNDMVVHSVSQRLPYWHGVWDGPMVQTNVTCVQFPGLNLCSTNVGPRIPKDAKFLMLGIGVVGNVPCGEFLSPNLTPAWQTFTNGVLPDSRHLVEFQDLQMDRLAQAWQRDGTWLTAHNTFGGGASVKFTLPGLNSTMGGRGGDSGGALFIADGDDTWKLFGFMRGAGYCLESESEITVLFKAPGFKREYWSLIGEPDKSGLRSSLASTPQYPCATVPTPGPVTIPTQPPLATNVVSVVVTNYMTITNYVTVTNGVNLGPLKITLEQTADDMEETIKKMRRLTR